MVTPSPLNLKQASGPSGFIELGGLTFVVDYGRIYHDGELIGHIFEDGFLRDTSGPLGHSEGFRLIDEIAGCAFRGIDANGANLELPGPNPGPSGSLIYNGRSFQVVNGRLADGDHRLYGTFDDLGNLSARDPSAPEGLRQFDDHTQLMTTFQGAKSNGSPWQFEFNRPLFRKDRSYSENEIIRYFQGFDNLSALQKKYVVETMLLWAHTGILQVVRRSEGDASLGNVRHGAAGVTGVRTGNVTLDREEFEREIDLYQQFGALAVVSKGIRNLTEVRINLVVAHEFGHQLEFVLTQSAQRRITELYEQRKKNCERMHPLPPNYNGFAELLEPQQVMIRHFLSGYSRTSMHEYWAECVAAFSIKDSREKLKEMDPAVHSMLEDVVLRPTTMLQLTLHDTIASLQASLRLGGEFDDNLLAR
jgi:hypothetical protein